MYLEIQLSRTCSSDRSLHCMQRRDVLIIGGTDFEELFVMVAQMEYIQLLLALVATKKEWPPHGREIRFRERGAR
jgi:hypothetical protein